MNSSYGRDISRPYDEDIAIRRLALENVVLMVKTMSEEQELSLDEARRMVAWLRKELAHQRELNGEMRRAVADLARAFQETLARAHDAAESGDIERVRRLTIENRNAWQAYLQQIVEAAKPKRDS